VTKTTLPSSLQQVPELVDFSLGPLSLLYHTLMGAHDSSGLCYSSLSWAGRIVDCTLGRQLMKIDTHQGVLPLCTGSLGTAWVTSSLLSITMYPYGPML
jgi:hypothetical protein